MARLLQRFVESPRPCSYLLGEQASLENRVMLDVSAAGFEAMLSRGWRRFGPVYFRPACRACAECVPIRVPTATFRPTTSQKRARKNLARLRVEVSVPRVDDERLSLYHLWHGSREGARGWQPSPLDAESYALEFAFPHPAARELAYYDDAAEGGPKLVGVGLCDQTPRAFSAIYFFYHPGYARLSLGAANVVYQIEYARSLGLAHVYLGFRVAGCPSMNYKSLYRPHELLVGRPGPTDEPEWQPAPDTDAPP